MTRLHFNASDENGVTVDDLFVRQVSRNPCSQMCCGTFDNSLVFDPLPWNAK